MVKAGEIDWRLYPASELARLAPQWDELNAALLDSPVLDAGFFQLALTHFGAGTERVAFGYVKDRLMACSILEKNRRLAWQSFQAAQAPMGAWLQSTRIDTAELLASLQTALGASCLVLGITQQDPDILPRPEPQDGFEIADYIRTARVSVSGSFEEYWSARGKNLRQNLRRQRNRLGREQVETRLEAVRSADLVGAAVDDYGLLESSGWKSEGGTSVHPDNAQGRFYRALQETYCARGEGAVFQYFYNDSLVASDLCLQRNGVLYLLKTAYCEKQKTSSPTMLMREETFRSFFDGGEVRRIEFYGRVMDWHTKWSDEIRTMYHVSRYRLPLLARLRGAAGKKNGTRSGADS